MSTEQLQIQHTAAKNVFFSVFDSTGKARDFADNTFKLLASHAINAVTTGGAGAGAFRVATDITALLVVGKKIRVRGSTGNDGVYTIRAGSAFSGGNTTVNVSEAVSNATVDGTLDLNATPYLAATEYTGPGGTGKSFYGVGLDLTALHKGGVVGQYLVAAYERFGTAPVRATDTVLGPPAALGVQFGERGAGALELEVNAAFTTTAGLEVRFLASLLRNGVRVPLETLDAAATLGLAAREQGAGADLFTIAPAVVNAAGAFELNKATPGYTADRLYKHTFTLTENGNTHTFVKQIPNHG